jgi:hypothetical protein
MRYKIIYVTKAAKGCIDESKAARSAMYFRKAAAGQEAANDDCDWCSF